MNRSRVPPSIHPLRVAAVRGLLVVLFLAPLASERMHDHAASGGLRMRTGGPGTSPARLAAGAARSVPGRTLPCLACLYHRAFHLDCSERALDARQAAVSPGERVLSDSPPATAPTVLRTAPRAPPA